MCFNKPKGGLKTKMNYIRKFKRNSKALSPVVASIILIAVTVAVSVVVAAWMGGMSLTLMGSAEQLTVTNVQFVDGASPTVDTVVVSIRNNGGADAAISKVYINGASVALSQVSPVTITKGTITDITITNDWAANTNYQLKFTTAAGNNVAYNQVAPAVDVAP
jgi:archaeal type IV pilus assembly protein PilA